jgi:hypothetical protein
MHSFTQSSVRRLILLGTVVAIAGAALGEVPEIGPASVERRWLPEACTLALEGEGASSSSVDLEESDEARWNRFYRRGIEALRSEALEAAEISYCRALEAARSFGPRDVRFAETLDELGLVSYLRGDDEGAEAMQGAAVAEMLLALGPPTEDLVATAETSCRSSVATYMVRLGWVFDRQGRGGEIDPLLWQPYLILGKGYVPSDSLFGRLDWLISQYLLIEDFAAADWLRSLRVEVR